MMHAKDQRVNRAVITLLMFSPVSFFFSHAYSESTFLMLATGAFLAVIRGQWLVGCLCGMCLSATRNIGVVIALPLFIEYLRYIWRSGYDWKALLHPRILFFGLVPLGLGLFVLYGYIAFHEPFAYLRAAAVWGRTLVPPWRTIANAQFLPEFHRWFNGAALVVGIIAWTLCCYLRLRLSYLVYAALLIMAYACSNSLEAMPRYLSVVFPLLIGLAVLSVRYPATYVPLFSCSTALLTLATILSAVGFWIT